LADQSQRQPQAQELERVRRRRLFRSWVLSLVWQPQVALSFQKSATMQTQFVVRN